jgi:hypothetical protein
MGSKTAVGKDEFAEHTGLPLATVFGAVDPNFLERANSCVSWADFSDAEKKPIDIFISDLTIKEPPKGHNPLQCGLVYGLQMARRITGLKRSANVLFLVDSSMVCSLSTFRSSGCRGLLLKSSVPKLLSFAIGDVSRGLPFLDPNIKYHGRLCKADIEALAITQRQVSVHFDKQELKLVATKEKLERRIRAAWFPKKAGPAIPLSLSFTVQSDGRPSNVHASQPINDHDLETAAEKALYMAAPFPEVPINVSVEVRFTICQFDLANHALAYWKHDR